MRQAHEFKIKVLTLRDDQACPRQPPREVGDECRGNALVDKIKECKRGKNVHAIAGVDPLGFPPYLPYRRAVMPVRVAIFNVVVDQREVVEQFQRYGDRKCPRTINPARLGREDCEQGTKALPGW